LLKKSQKRVKVYKPSNNISSLYLWWALFPS